MYGPSSNFGRVAEDDDDDDDNRLLIIVMYADESIGKRSSSDFLSVVTMTLTSSANADAMSAAQSPRITRPCAIVMASNPSDAIVASSESSFLFSGVEPAADAILLSVRARVASAVSIYDVHVADDADNSSTADCWWWISSLDSSLDNLYNSSRVIRRALPMRMVRRWSCAMVAVGGRTEE
jgi:hypothetical protein